MTKDILLNSEEIKIKNYSEYSANELKYHMLTRVNWMPISEKAKKKLMDNIESVPSNPSADQLKELQKAAIVLDIVNNVVFEHSSQVMKGAHVMVRDNGALYEKLVSEGIVNERISSHHKNNKEKSDVSLQSGTIFKEFLVGKTKDGRTWFQVEAHSTGGISNLIGHLIDYIKYKITGKNVGQYGLSKHVDSNPINVNLKEKAKQITTIVKDKYKLTQEQQSKTQVELDRKYINASQPGLQKFTSSRRL